VVTTLEQRGEGRTTVEWPVSVWHPGASRFFNGKSLNVSSSGTLLTLPIKTPLREGQSVEVNFPRRDSLAREKGASARIKPARVVRVDRSEMLHSATIKVGLAFCEQGEPALCPT